ncbi:Replication fork protection component Swi3 [Artemisia annua]|uniref:Replication fork protection component Swi3 n=1 Tax=Artemisia annua TaxID=35608 RepID=A0A2U1PMK0_ARTAN|nr:Replication fork protection component Swi3 [Artemisia annua]
METNAGAAPTGCYKCGRPAATSHPFTPSGVAQKQIEKPKKVPKTRPKLTPELLLSDDGLGFVLRHFPKAFKCRGRGHETSDLGNLLSLYAEWHSQLIPYYSFDHFVHKLEQVGGSKRVKLCLRDLQEKVANGGDPVLETPEPHEDPNNEQDAINLEEPNDHPEDTLPNHDTDDFQHNLFDEIYQNTTEEPSPSLVNEGTIADTTVPKEPPPQTTDTNSIEMSEELKARIESNRLKALERVAARKRALESQAS